MHSYSFFNVLLITLCILCPMSARSQVHLKPQSHQTYKEPITLDLNDRNDSTPKNPYRDMFFDSYSRTEDTFLDMVNILEKRNLYALRFDQDTMSSVFNSYGIIYQKRVHFWDCGFHGAVDFRADTFKDEASFFRTRFYYRTNFSQQKANCVFESKSDFRLTAFYDGANFEAAEYKGEADFLLSNFNNNTDFSQAHFKKDVNFNSIHSNNFLNFSQAFFGGKVDFTNAKISGRISFTSMHLGDSAQLIFDQTILPDTLNFSGVTKIPTLIDLTSARYDSVAAYDYLRHVYYLKKRTLPIELSLWNTDVSKLKFDYQLFHVSLPNSRIYHEDISGMCEQLLKNFKDNGYTNSYEKLDIQYQRYKYTWIAWESETRYLPIPLWVVPFIWWRFGYSKWFIFPWILFFISIFTLITFYKFDSLNGEVYKVFDFSSPSPAPARRFKFIGGARREELIEILGEYPPPPPPRVLARYEKLWYAFLYTSSIFFRLTLKEDRFDFDRKKGVAYIILIYAVGVICLGYLANFVIQR